jgi:tripartite-type tricarboxylate transporter receptor subunit TctC
MKMKKVLLGLLILVMTTSGVFAAAYPERPITFICPWSAGGGSDRVARVIAMLLEKDLGKPVSVVNRTGGGGAIGHHEIAAAKPDGYTIGLATTEITMMHWMGLTKVSYRDYECIVLVNEDPAGVIVRADAPWKNLEQLQAAIKAKPGNYKASGAGRGGIWDISRYGWLASLGLKDVALPWVPLAGAAPALQELAAGGIDVAVCSLPEASTLIEAGKVKALAIMADKRDPHYPDVPTLKERRINFSSSAYRGVVAPAKTPRGIVAKLERAVLKVAKSKEYIDMLDKNGFGCAALGRKKFTKFLTEKDQEHQKIMAGIGLIRK